MLALVVGLGLVFVSEASAIHRRRVVVTYGPGYVSPAFAGPSSFNPVGFGFGGYSYGGYPYYGYYGYLPGPYEGFSGYAPGGGPFYGQVAYNAYAAAQATGLDATAAGQSAIMPPGYDPACFMTPHAYRRYVRRLNRTLASCCYWGWGCPLVAPCAYGAMLGTSALVDGDGEEFIVGYTGDVTDEVIGIDPSATDGEQVAPPTEAAPLDGTPRNNGPLNDSPRPALEPSF
jgi:hypothetical protein